jgi:hypothetical protein
MKKAEEASSCGGSSSRGATVAMTAGLAAAGAATELC